MEGDPAVEKFAHTAGMKSIAGHKLQINKASTLLEECVTANEIHPDNIEIVETYLCMVETQLGKIERIFDGLVSNSNTTEDFSNDLTGFILDKGTLCRKIKKLLNITKSNIDPIQPPILPPQNPSGPLKLDTSGLGEALKASLSELNINKQLSVKDLPYFNGEPSEFLPFWESFNFLVHQDNKIPEVLKSTYLKKCIKEKGPDGKPNPAFELLKHIPPISENYNLMREKLEDRFKLKYQNKVIYISNLRQLSTWKPCNTGPELRKLYDHINQNMDLLELAGGSSLNESDILLSDVLSLLPRFLVNNFLEKEEDERDLNNLLREIETAASRMLEREALTKTNKPNVVRHNYNNPYSNRHTNRGSTFNTNSRDSSCLFCDGYHNALSCNNKSLSDRITIANQKRVCNNCLKPNHFSSNCFANKNCDCANRTKHCRALCYQREGTMTQDFQGGWRRPSTQVNRGRGYRGRGHEGFRNNNSPHGNNNNNSPGNNNNSSPGTTAGNSTDNRNLSISAFADNECYFEIAQGFVKSKFSDEFVPIRLMLDSASSGSYIKRDVLKQISCDKIGVKSIEIDTFSGGEVKCQDCDVVKLVIFDRNNYFEPTEICVSAVNSICRDVPTWKLTPHQSSSIRNYQLSEPNQISGKLLSIDMLIGLDHYWKFMERRTDDPGFGPRLRSSKLGWILSGQRDYSKPRLLTNISTNPLTNSIQTMFINSVSQPVKSISSENPVNFCNNSCENLESCSEEEHYCSQFADLETFGIKPETEISPVLEQFNSTIVFNNETKRYKVKLPFILKCKDQLGSHFNLSKIMIDCLFNKFQKEGNEEFTKKYFDIIKEQEDLGIIEQVHVIPNENETGVHYIPHHGVFKQGSDKLRVVYNGSAHLTNSMSLNDCLNPGPSLTNELIEMLMRFRTYSVVLTGDITKAFLQIEVAEEDRDYLRFLWYNTDGKLIVYRFKRVPFGLRCSSFLLNATIKYHMDLQLKGSNDPCLLNLLNKSNYVDDWLTGAKTSEEVLEIKCKLSNLLEPIGMQLHKFNSNSEIVRKKLEINSPEIDTVLGLPWNVETDLISFNIERAVNKFGDKNTKCELYSTPPRIFDPLGLLQPFMFNAKLLFVDVCKMKLKWKSILPPDIEERFQKWKSQIPKLAKIQIPRCVLINNYEQVELHGFGDSSQLGYCACIYLVSGNGCSRVSHLLVSKTRVAPNREMSIPRLELTAAFLLAKLMAIVVKFHEHIKFDQVVYYSDSTTVLHWIQSDHRQWKVYVANRIRDINLLSLPEQWKYVRSGSNPADLGTRGITADELVGNRLWFYGPEFLVSKDVSNDSDIEGNLPTVELSNERRKIALVSNKVSVVDRIVSLCSSKANRKLSDHSSIGKLIRVIGHIYKFIYLKLGSDRFVKWIGFTLAVDTNFVGLAEIRLVQAVQEDHFKDEIQFCRGSPKVIPSGLKVVKSSIQQLRLFMDDKGVLHVGTLLGNADIPYSAKEPILLPKNCHFTVLIVRRIHEFLNHAKVGHTLTELRQNYWVPQGRQVVRNILRNCLRCKLMVSKPYPILAQPQLPNFRVEKAECFQNTGVDFAGPLVIGSLSNVIRKRKLVVQKKVDVDRKVWLVVFTCAVSRMVHAEVLDGMTVVDFMHGLRRFVSRYGPPNFFYSDNALTFKCVARELPDVISHPKLHSYLSSKEMSWHFYVEKAPWMGGFIERVVGLYKDSIKKVVGRARLDYQEFVTLISELNGILNSRPISYVYDTVGEEEVITPSKLWCGKNITLFPPFHDIKLQGSSPEICSKRLRYLDKVLTHFWNRFSTQYLSSLSERHFNRNLPREGKQPKVDDVVLVKNDSLPRCQWKIGRVIEVTPGSDGIIRRVRLKLGSSASGKHNTLTEINRPPRLLIPLECELENNQINCDIE